MATLLVPLTTTFSSSSPLDLRKQQHRSPPQLVALATSKHGTLKKPASSRIQFRSNRFLLPFIPKALRRTNGIVCEASETLLVGSVPAVTDQTWESVVHKADSPVLVEFWAPWCGPCRMLHPVVGELSKQYAGRVNCFQLNTDDNPSIATQYGIRSIPTIMIFVKGEKKDAIIGAVPKSNIAARLEKFL